MRVAVQWGAGGNFCAGADLSALHDPDKRNEIDPEGCGPGPMGPTRMMLSKPAIAAVAGYAVAGGLESLRCCAICGWRRRRRYSGCSAAAGACR